MTERSGGTRWIPLSAWVLAVVLFAALNLVVPVLEPGFMRLRMYDLQYGAVRVRDYADAPRPDIIFMGSSRALNGFDPAQTESEIAHSDNVAVHALNLGVAGGSIDINYLILKNIISEKKQPSVIVYGLSEFELLSLTSDDLAQQLEVPLLERIDDLPLYGGSTADDKVSFVLKRLLPLYRDHELIRSALSIRFNPNDAAHQYYVEHHDLPANGFVPLPTSVTASAAALEQHREEYGYKLSRYHIDPAALARLHSFITLAQSRGIAVVLVNMPVTPEHRALWQSAENIGRYRVVVQDVADTHHIPLLDLYEDRSHIMPANAFFDYQHLNLTGTRVLTNLVTQLSLIDRFRDEPQRLADVSLSDLQAPTALPPGATANASVTIQDNARSPAEDTACRHVVLEYRWIDTFGYVAKRDDPAMPVAIAVRPGQQRVDIPLIGAPMPGSYILEIHLVEQPDGAGAPLPLAASTVVRQPVTIGVPGPVIASDELFRASLSRLQASTAMRPGTLGAGSVTVRNDSRDSWPGLNVSYHWLDQSGREVVHDGRRTPLPKGIQPGQAVRSDFAIESPPTPGAYLLVVDLVYEEVGWFGTHGSMTIQQPVAVGG